MVFSTTCSTDIEAVGPVKPVPHAMILKDIYWHYLLQDGNIEVIANAAGDRVTPSLVAFSDHDKVRGQLPIEFNCVDWSVVGSDRTSGLIEQWLQLILVVITTLFKIIFAIVAQMCVLDMEIYPILSKCALLL